jgi:hypothetical protein
LEARLGRVWKAAAAALSCAGIAASLAAQPPARALNLTREESAALAALATAAAGYDRGAQDAALAAARAAAHGADARYALAHYELEIARARGDMQLQGQAVDAIVDSGLATPEELPSLLANQASRAYSGRDQGRAERLMARIVELQPNNPDALADYAQYKSRVRASAPSVAQADRALSVSLFQRALAANAAAGRPSPESLHRRALAVAYDATQRVNGAPPLAPQVAPQAIAFGRELVAAYPSPRNWRDALLVYRDLAQADPALVLDIRRLMRASESLGGAQAYLDTAAALGAAGDVGGAKAVLDEGVVRGQLDPAQPAIAATIAAATRRAATGRAALAGLRARATTAAAAVAAGDALFGYGQYAEAAAMYQTALQRGGEDPNLVNSRLGAALALAGQRPAAEEALHAVSGPRADLAGFWLVWLAHRPG